MPDDLYHRDVLEWAEHQAALLHRESGGERVDDVDWEHVVEEIEDVGLSELAAVRSYPRQLFIDMLKIQGWPSCSAGEHWRNELALFQTEAADRFAASRRQRIDVGAIRGQALRVVSGMRIDGEPPGVMEETSPFLLDALLTADTPALIDRIKANSGAD